MTKKAYHNVTLAEIEALLAPQGFKRVNTKKFKPDDRTVEIVYGKRVDQDGLVLSLRIFTGIEPTGIEPTGNSRGSGEDAIRVALWMRRPSDGYPVEVGGSKKVLRIQTWANNLQERLDSWLDYMPKERCPDCESPLIPKQTRDGKRRFLGCSNYPLCRYTKSITQANA